MMRRVLGKAASWERVRRACSLGALGALLAACGSVGGGPVRTPEPSSYHDVPVSLDGSLATAGGTWAVIKMGHLDQFANTFWQLFVLHRGDTRWSLVTPPGFADNGGLVANSADDKSLVTGFQASQLNHFSPLAVTSDGGKNWAPGVLAQGLANVPDALAASTSGEMLALVGGSAPSVLTSGRDLSQWQPLVSEKSLATSAAGRTCAVTRLTAVGFAPGGQPIVGASCSNPGSVGIFEYTKGVWHSFAPRLPTSMSHATIQVVRLLSLSGTVSAIVAVRAGSDVKLIATRYLPRRNLWELSGALSVPTSAQVLSSGTTSSGVFVALSSGKSERVEVQATFNGPWTQLPVVPKCTETVAFSSNGRVDALVSRDSVLADYTLDVSGGRWELAQVINVPIQYGSSS